MVISKCTIIVPHIFFKNPSTIIKTIINNKNIKY